MVSGKIYLCGPMDNCDNFERHAWRNETTALLGADYVLDPTRRDYTQQQLTAKLERELVDLDLVDLSECVGVIAYIWKPSYGSPMELCYAHWWRKPTAVIVPPMSFVSPWVKYHADYVTQNGVVDAVEWMRKKLRWM